MKKPHPNGAAIGELKNTIIPITGDLEQEWVANGLPEQVDYVIHAAASVKHYGSWQYFKRTNVDATRRIVSYAQKIGAKLIHISTISVFGNSMADQFDGYVSEEEKHFYESSLYIGQPLDNVYIRSKFDAETLVLDAMMAGLRANIIRIGNLTNRKSDLKFQPNYVENAFLKRVKAVLELGCFPDYLMHLYAEFSPVDYAAEAIVSIAEHMNNKYTVFHVNSNKELFFDRMLEYLKLAGYPMQILDGAQFSERIRDTISSSRTYIFEALSNDLDVNDQLQYDSNIRIENEFTVQYLKSIGFEWPEIDFAYVEGKIKLDKLTTLDLQKFYNKTKTGGRVEKYDGMKNKELSARTVRGLHAMLRQCLDQAVQERLIPHNPAIGCRLPPKEKKEMQILPPEKIGAYLSAAEEHGVLPMFYLELTTGLRRGELVALLWTDLDVKARTLTVSKSAGRLKGEVRVTELKTANSVRTICLPKETVDLLVQEHAKHLTNPVMFPSPVTGKIYGPDCVGRLHKTLLKKAGVTENIPLHGLRHTFATLAIQNGVDAKTVSSILGHYSAGFTLDTYTHVTGEMQKEAADRVGGFIAQVM